MKKLTVPLLVVTVGLLLGSFLMMVLATPLGNFLTGPRGTLVERQQAAADILATGMLLLFFGLPTLIVGWVLRPHLEAQLEAENPDPVARPVEDKLAPSQATRFRRSLQPQR